MKTLAPLEKKVLIIAVLFCLVEISYYFWIITYPPETPISCEFVVHSVVHSATKIQQFTGYWCLRWVSYNPEVV